MILEDKLSHNLPIDFENMYKDAIRNVIVNGQVIDLDTVRSLLSNLIERNIRGSDKEHVKDEILKMFEKIINVVDVSEKGYRSLIEYVMNGLNILRSFPR